MGEDESTVVERRVCVIESDELPTFSGKQGYWLNHVMAINDEEAFGDYFGAVSKMIEAGDFQLSAFGPVVHQHAGEKQVAVAAICTFENVGAAIDVYQRPDYAAARAAGGMSDGESHVVDRTVAVLEGPE